jgi:hypothetical protein
LNNIKNEQQQLNESHHHNSNSIDSNTEVTTSESEITTAQHTLNDQNDDNNQGQCSADTKSNQDQINMKTNEEMLFIPNQQQTAQNNNYSFQNGNDFLINHTKNMFQEEDLGFDPWCESTRALQDLMQIEKTTTTTTTSLNNSALSQPQQQNNISNKTILSHIEFLQKQFEQPNTTTTNTTTSANTENPNKMLTNGPGNKASHNNNNNNNNNSSGVMMPPAPSNFSNSQYNTFLSQANELLASPIKNLINSNQALFNKRLAEFNILNQTNFLNQQHNQHQHHHHHHPHQQQQQQQQQDNMTTTATIQQFTDFLGNSKNTIPQGFLNNNNMNIINSFANVNQQQQQQQQQQQRLTQQNATLLRNVQAGGIVPPPGFGAAAASSNSNNQASSSSSLSSSNSSSVDSSASSTPALNSNPLPNNKLSYSSSVKENPAAKQQQQIEASNENSSSHLNLNGLKQDLSDLSIQNSFHQQNGHSSHQFNNLLLNNNDENNSLMQSDTLNLHKTLKSILPHANISFGNNNNATNTNNNNFHAKNNSNTLQFNSPSSSTENRMSQHHNNNNNNFWPDDPAIVSLTDRSHNFANGLTNSFSDLQYQLVNNNNNNNSNGSVSPSLFSALSNISNKNQATINHLKLQNARFQQQNAEQQQQQQFLNNQYFQNFNNNNKIDDTLLYRLQTFNHTGLNGLNDASSLNNIQSGQSSLFSTSLINDQLSHLINQDANGMNSLNMASLNLHQQFLMQQLTTNFAAKQKLPSE